MLSSIGTNASTIQSQDKVHRLHNNRNHKRSNNPTFICQFLQIRRLKLFVPTLTNRERILNFMATKTAVKSVFARETETNVPSLAVELSIIIVREGSRCICYFFCGEPTIDSYLFRLVLKSVKENILKQFPWHTANHFEHKLWLFPRFCCCFASSLNFEMRFCVPAIHLQPTIYFYHINVCDMVAQTCDAELVSTTGAGCSYSNMTSSSFSSLSVSLFD